MNPTEAVTLRLMSMALDASMLKQQVIASNIANASNADYRPLRVHFDEKLKSALEQLQGSTHGPALNFQELQPEIEVLDASEKTSVDLEMGQMAQNMIRYQSLIKGLQHHYQLMAVAVADGKR